METEWCRVLWKKQHSFPDNYVGDSFLRVSKKQNGAPSVVIHTSVPFGKAYVEETPDQVQPVIVKKVKELFPEWPEPTFVKCQKWRFSQVTSAFPGLPGCVTLADGLVIGGDGFTHSNMDGCIESAKSIVDTIVQYLNKSS